MRYEPINELRVKRHEFRGVPTWNVSGTLIDHHTDVMYDCSGWFEVWRDGKLHLGWESTPGWGKCSRRENLNRLCHAARVYGRPYAGTVPVKERLTARVEKFLNTSQVREAMATEVQFTKTITEADGQIERTGPSTTTRTSTMTNEITNDSKAPKVTFGRCQAVPRSTAKETSGQCPRMVTTQNEHGLCGGHLNFLSRGAEIKLQNGTVLNPKPAAEPKAAKVEEQGTRVDLSTPHVDIQVTPEVTPKPKKQSKAKKAADALATLQAKDAQRADQTPAN